MDFEFGTYINKNNRSIYEAYGIIINATSAQNCQIMVGYRNMDGQEFVREINEFFKNLIKRKDEKDTNNAKIKKMILYVEILYLLLILSIIYSVGILLVIAKIN
jgi:hypothetical protein